MTLFGSWWFSLRWSATRCWFSLFRRVSLYSVTLFFILGQALGILGSPMVRILALLLLLGSSLIALLLCTITSRYKPSSLHYARERRLRVFVSLVSCTVVGVIAVSGHPPRTVTPESEAALSGIVHSLRRPAPGAIQFRILAARQDSPKAKPAAMNAYEPLNLLCRAAALPWRWASKIREGDTIDFVASIEPLRLSKSGIGYEDSLYRAGIDAICSVTWLSITSLISDKGTEESSKHFDDKINEQIGINLAERALIPQFRTIPDKLNDLVTRIVGNTESAALLLSMTIGTRDRLSKDTEELFRYFGLAHLLVISGYQLSQLVRLLSMIMRGLIGLLWRQVDRLPLRMLPPLASISCGLVLGTIVGFEVSITRAIVGVILIELIKSAEGLQQMGHTLVVTALVMSGLWPGILFEPAGALTMSALSGIVIGSYVGGTGWKGIVGAHAGALLLATTISMIWFPPPHLGAAVLAAPFAALFGVIALYCTITGIGLFSAGLDSDGLFLKTIAQLVETIRRVFWQVRLW